MGIIILPYLLGAIIAVIISIVKISNQLTENTFNSVNIIYGVLLALLIYGLIVISYKVEEKPWALSPVFRFPLFMIYLPFGILYLSSNFIEINIINQLHDLLLISVVSAAIFMVVFNGYIFNILDKLGKKKHY